MQVSIRTLEVLSELQNLAGRLAANRQTNGAVGQSAALLNRLEVLPQEWGEILYQRDAATLEALTTLRTSGETLEARLESRFDNLLNRLDASPREWDESQGQSDAAKLNTVRSLLKALGSRWESSLDSLRDQLATDYLAPPAESLGFEMRNPEPALMNHLYGLLPVATAVDVGAHRGDISRCLLDTGYQVHAFEPAPRTFEELRERLGGRDDCHLYACAIGAADTTMPLFIAEHVLADHNYSDASLFNSLVAHAMPPALRFAHSVNVPVRSLKSLVCEGKIPAEIGLLKVDTEGFDLQVLRGLQDLQPHVVAAEFWAQDFVFGQAGAFNRLDELVKEMRDRGYRWHIVMYRISGSERVSFFCNYANPLSDSWGNVFFFRDYRVFTEAAKWCAAVLPRTELVLDDPTHPSALARREAPPVKSAADIDERKQLLCGAEREKMRGLEERLADSERDVRVITEKAAGLEELLAARNVEFAAREHEVNAITEDFEKRLAAAEQERARGALYFRDLAAQFESKLNNAKVEAQRATAEAQRQSERANELAGAVQALKSRMRRIRRSWSWKMTAPLREIRRFGIRIYRYFGSLWSSS